MIRRTCSLTPLIAVMLVGSVTVYGQVRQVPPKLPYAKLDSGLASLVVRVDAGLAPDEAVTQLRNRLTLPGVVPVSIRTTNVPGVHSWLRGASAKVANLGDGVVEAYVSPGILRDLDRLELVERVNEIIPPNEHAISQGRLVHNATSWLSNGYSGAGVKVGIIDSFNGFSALIGTELPATVVARCYSSIGVHSPTLAACQTGSNHGTGVAESLVDVAPGVQLFIANPISRLDLRQTIDWMTSQGVRVINYSVGWVWDGPGDGSSPFIDSPLVSAGAAVNGGAVFVAAAGNHGQSTYLGVFSDTNGNGWAEFPAGTDDNLVFVSAGQSIRIQLRWQDTWGAAARDLDLGLYDASLNLLAASANVQNGSAGGVPFEFLSYTAPVTGWYVVGIHRFSGATPGWIQLQAFTGHPLGLYTLGGSITNPAESANPGVLAVGAAAWNSTSTIEPYSSMGPTPDGRVKPDIVGADRADTVTYGPSAFTGTSQASPHVAGLAALVLQAFPSFTPAEVANYLKTFAAPRGSGRPNNTWGFGFATLPDVCSYTLSATSLTASASGGIASVTVTPSASACPWSATSNVAWITITAGASRTGSGTVTYSVDANATGAARVGSLTIAGQTVTVTQLATGAAPIVTLNRSALIFSATSTGAAFTAQTSAQIVQLTQTGSGAISWMATSSQPWLAVSPSSGIGSATLLVGLQYVGGLPTSGTRTATITLSMSGAGNSVSPVNVTLTIRPAGSGANPFGVIDTPTQGATGVTGTVPFTGWGLDDVEVTGMALCRAAVTGETAPLDPRCNNAAQIYVGNAVFIDGARPDVSAAFPSYPLNTRAGWGFAVLTNMLPNQGNGTYNFFFYLTDRDGHTALLGTRTVTCTNATASTPFGAIDTPGQGETVSGSGYVNFGWALTPQPKTIPTDGSTINVFVDGAPIGTVNYNHFRSDIATLFPGLNNTNGPIGFRVIDTTALTNGVHTIAWGVRDSAGSVTGVGSRFFTVSNGASRPTANDGTAALAAGRASSIEATNGAPLPHQDVTAAPRDEGGILARRGWDLDAPLRRYPVNEANVATIFGEELDRFELHIARDSHSASAIAGYLRAGDALEPLPIGSQLDPATGVFTWHPGVGFVGAYDLVFVRWAHGRAVARQEVRIVLSSKGSGRVGPQVVIDAPRMVDEVGRTFYIGGWAADLDAEGGTGISTLHAWAYPAGGGRPIFLGVPVMNAARPDVAAVYGDQFRDTGWGLVVRSLPPGVYDLAVFASRESTGAFLPAKVVRVHVK